MTTFNDEELAELLRSARTIAVVGLSNKPWRASHNVAEFLQQQGYRVIPVNPNIEETLGEKAYPRLEDVPIPIDIVDVFRRSEFVGDLVTPVLARAPRCLWLQQGVVHQDAAQRVAAAGIGVVMDRCILQDYQRLSR